MSNSDGGSKQKIIIATNNQGKVVELKALLEPLGYLPVSLADENISVVITEDGDTFEENAHIKAQLVYDMLRVPVIADDSGLEVEFLNGAPGIYSARYGGEDLTDADRCGLILEELEGARDELRAAKFVCAIYFIKDDHTEYSVTGEWSGFIGTKPLGHDGFGYDPIFMIDEERSVAMLSSAEKNKLSHRAKALAALKKALLKERGN